MKRRRLILLTLLGAVLAVLLAAALWPQEREPTYEGRKLSQWLRDYRANRNIAAAAMARATNAVHHIGTNALPCAVKWINYAMPKWKYKLFRILPPLPPSVGGMRLAVLLVGLGPFRVDQALASFEILGPEAAPAVPELARMLKRGGPADRIRNVHMALMFVGEAGLAPLVSVVTNKSVATWAREDAAERIAAPAMRLGTKASWAVPVLIGCLQDTNVASEVALALGQFTWESKTVVPPLVRCLGNGDPLLRIYATETLGRFGTNAAAAKPELVGALSSNDRLLRETATNALMKIAPEVLGQDDH
ncbi:MAG TPA: HEAT repeat domain-containing protein [Candidatus Acidoferrum sp.]|nr:HEAT repeat domain-containing protein [Candidatus Acidoferrum sp.]